MTTPVVWAIGGSDASGAAGIQADVRTLGNFGVHAATVVTAVTAQSLKAFGANAPVAPAAVAAQLDAISGALAPRAIKIGMLATREIVELVAARLNALAVPVVVDPVLMSSSGAPLLATDAVQTFVRAIVPRATLLTPNVPEAEALTGFPIHSADDIVRAAAKLLDLGASRVVIKGGHGPQSDLVQDYYADAAHHFWISGPTHAGRCRGTGCTYAAAAAATLALGHDVEDAVVVAKAYVARGIRASEPRPDDGPRLLRHDTWPVSAADWPWVNATADAARHRPIFPSSGPEPIGFYPIVDRAAWIARLAPHGARTVQIRIKDLQGEALTTELKEAVRLSRIHNVRLFVNDYWRFALEHQAFGVHLGQEDLCDADLDAIRRGDLRLGVSTHSYFEAAVAAAIRPSYVALGPIFATTCKSMRFGPQGLARLAEWRALLQGPLVAIGGLRPEHVADARRFGAEGFAAVSDVLRDPNPEDRVRLWCERVCQCLAQ